MSTGYTAGLLSFAKKCKMEAAAILNCYLVTLEHQRRDSLLVVSVLDFRSPRDPGSSLAAAGGHVATVGQLLFAPWAWAYSTLHP